MAELFEEASAEMQKKVIPVNGIPTVISTVLPRDTCPKVSVVIIPGNPGLVEYYDLFIEALFEASRKTLAIYGISHADTEVVSCPLLFAFSLPPVKNIKGHSPVLAEYTKNKDVEEKDASESFQSCVISTGTYSLREQIAHKKAFLEQHVPQNTKIILIGHSIGAYIILKLLKECTRENDIIKCILLFPTIERMAVSPNGRFVTPFVNYFKWFAVSTLSVVSFFPQSFVKFLVQWWFSGRNVQDGVVETTMRLINSEASSNSLEMARCEMAEVTELDEEIISKHLKQLIFYYGATDQWAPVSYYEDIKKKFPEGEIYLCDKGFEHAFVLTSSTQVAEMVWGWIDKLSF